MRNPDAAWTRGPRARPRWWSVLLGFALASTLSVAAGFGQPGASVTLRSPSRSLLKTRKLVDALALRILVDLGYQERSARGGEWKTAGVPGVMLGRYFSRELPGDVVRRLELAVASYPAGGFELVLYGQEVSASGSEANPDLADVEATAQQLVGDLDAAQSGAQQTPEVGYQTYQLSYVQSDRALGLLKALGYSVVEYRGDVGESPNDKIFSPEQMADQKLPVVVKLIEPAKTSLMDAAPSEQMRPEDRGGQETLPDLGGVYLHSVTSGEPPQRLLIVYDRDDPETVERLLNLLEQQIDVPAAQILIEALVIELNSSRLSDFGLAVGSSGVKGSGTAGTRKGFDVNYGEPAASSTDGETTSSFDPFTFIFSRTGLGDTFSFRATLKALVERGDAEILSNPSVLVLDGRQARIQVGQNQPVTETVAASRDAVGQSVRYFPVGIVLNLRPRIAEGGSEIVMQVETIVSAVAGTASQGVLSAPVVDNRQVQTFVRVANNTPFIIGGLISTEKTKNTSGVPLLSDIPLLGALFRRTELSNVKKEVIVVLTPHVVPQKEKNFTFIIPQESEIFDSFHHELFRNAYRVRDQDVFDLEFLYASDFYRQLRDRVEAAVAVDRTLRDDPAIAAVVDGGVPGEAVLVRRMLWEIVRRKQYQKYVDEKKIFFFEEAPDSPDGRGLKWALLDRRWRELDREHNAFILTYDTNLAGTPEHPFVQPRASVEFESIPADHYVESLLKANQRMPDGSPSHWAVVLGREWAGVSSPPLEALKIVLVLKRLLALNPDLPLTLREFYPGKQIVFPTEADIEERWHMLDPEAARLFYEVMLYYPAFEQEFIYQTRRINRLLDGRRSE